ncbi:MAG: hypothetical protein HYW49_09245 [Deltaproteobacteria bacterium]|nr:hypothetical protein [Deltaproteobacteria bacterium]
MRIHLIAIFLILMGSTAFGQGFKPVSPNQAQQGMATQYEGIIKEACSKVSPDMPLTDPNFDSAKIALCWKVQRLQSDLADCRSKKATGSPAVDEGATLKKMMPDTLKNNTGSTPLKTPTGTTQH